MPVAWYVLQALCLAGVWMHWAFSLRRLDAREGALGRSGVQSVLLAEARSVPDAALVFVLCGTLAANVLFSWRQATRVGAAVMLTLLFAGASVALAAHRVRAEDAIRMADKGMPSAAQTPPASDALR